MEDKRLNEKIGSMDTEMRVGDGLGEVGGREW